MADDPALIWQDEERSEPRRAPRRPAPGPAATAPEKAPPPTVDAAAEAAADPAAEAAADAAAEVGGGRVSLRDAHHQFGVALSTLASWARSGKVDGIKDDGKWMVTPASVAARLSETRSRKPAARRDDTPGPAGDGSSMLVPRDAWDKLLDQLGNLHEAGQMLAEARERAAKAETEATFLRERLSEMRGERDELKGRLGGPIAAGDPRPGWWARLRRSVAGDPSATPPTGE